MDITNLIQEAIAEGDEKWMVRKNLADYRTKGQTVSRELPTEANTETPEETPELPPAVPETPETTRRPKRQGATGDPTQTVHEPPSSSEETAKVYDNNERVRPEYNHRTGRLLSLSEEQVDWWNRELCTLSADLLKEKQYSGRLLYKIEELERYKARSEVLIFGPNNAIVPSECRHEFIVGEFVSHLHHKGKTFRQFYDSKDWKAIQWVAVFGCQSERLWVRLLCAYVTDRAMLEGVYIMAENVSPDDVLDIAIIE